MSALGQNADISNFVETPLTGDIRDNNSRIVETMNGPAVILALGALAQEHRLALFRLLVQAGDQGMPAGAIADTLALPSSSLSFHLAALRNAGLIRPERKGRSLIYSVDYTAMNDLLGYLMDNCCGGKDCSTAASRRIEAA